MSTALMTRDSVRSLFAKQHGEIAKALPKHLDADTFIRVFLTAINKTPKLLECSQASLMQAAMDLAQLGLVADSVMGLAYLLPFNDRQRGMICQLIVGYQGYVELAYRSPKVTSIRWNHVYATDRFLYTDGFEPKLIHEPSDEEDPGPLVKAYCIVELAEGGRTWSVLNKRDIAKVRASSRSANSDYSPWTQWEAQMWDKSAVKAALKKVPKSRDLELAYTRDADDAVIDVASQVMNQTPTISIADETPKETTQPDPAPAAGPAPQEAPVATPPAAASPESKRPAKAKAVKEEVLVSKQTPPASLFEESEDHKKLRAMAEEAGITEARLLEYLRNEGLAEDTDSDIIMLPQKRVGTIIRSWEGMVGEINK